MKKPPRSIVLVQPIVSYKSSITKYYKNGTTRATLKFMAKDVGIRSTPNQEM